MTGQEAILGMNFMVPAGIQLDFANGALCLPDEISIQLSGRRPLYGEYLRWIDPKRMMIVKAAEFVKNPLGSRPSETLGLDLQLRRYAQWQNLVFQATTDELEQIEDLIEGSTEPLVERPEYD
ncbi:hypothetical protein PInf_017773 [Phytophthora infestans]|nr:hypothetical protein PInf_017773 [Phytophthora infestans]